MANAKTSIRRKLMTGIMSTSLVVLIFTCLVFITYEVITYRKGLVVAVQTRADILAANVTGALAFQNQQDATEVLSTLQRDPRIMAACLYDKDGRLFAMYPPNAPAEIFPKSPPHQEHFFEKEDYVVFTPVMRDNRWYGTVYLKFSLSSLRERYHFYSIMVLAVIVIAILVAYALSTRLQKRIAGPILRLADTARNVSEWKDYSVRACKISDDETGVLTDSFNEMLSEIQRRESSLRESAARMRAVLESALDCILTIDHEGRIVEFNPAAEKIFGYTRDGAIGAKLTKLVTFPSLGTEEDGLVSRLIVEGSDLLGKRMETTAVRADHTEFPAELTITRIAREGPPMFTGFIRDITDRKRAEQEILQLNSELEQRVIKRTEELEASNKELEAFSYSVSHDLRAPLRGIDGFSRALLEENGPNLDEEAKRKLGRVRSASQHMASLIDALLKLSRINRLDMRQEPVDLSLIATQVAAELQQSQPQRSVVFKITDGMITQGDPQLLRVVLDNLFRNSWKYTSKHPTAKIEFGRLERDGECVYFVRDDGAGFEMAHANLLFTPFQRLHRQTDFEGTGVGLATVQRIIRRHGGRLWAEGAVEQGATFYFTM
jgi:PAS domain S-box-containing protein